MKAFFDKLKKVFWETLDKIEVYTGIDVNVLRSILNIGLILGFLVPPLITMMEHPEYTNTQLLIHHWKDYLMLVIFGLAINIIFQPKN